MRSWIKRMGIRLNTDVHYTTGTGHGALCDVASEWIYWFPGASKLLSQDKADVTCQDCKEWLHS